MTQKEKRNQCEVYLDELGYTEKVNWAKTEPIFQYLFGTDIVKTSEVYSIQHIEHWRYHWIKVDDFGSQIYEHPVEDHLLEELKHRCMED